MKAGTTPAWKRPVMLKISLVNRDELTDIDLPKLLKETRMAQSMAEARRLIEQNIIWRDTEGEGTVWDRMEKVKPFLHENRWLFVEPGDCLMVGRTKDEAAPHRISFI